MPNCKYKKLKQQQSFDGGNSLFDVYQSGLLVIKKGDLIEKNSIDCGYEGEYIRWVVVDGYLCDYTTYNKYKKEKKQKSTDNKTWTDTGEYRQGKLIEENSKDCGYTEVQYRWVVINDNSRYVCVGTEKHKMEIRQLSND